MHRYTLLIIASLLLCTATASATDSTMVRHTPSHHNWAVKLPLVNLFDYNSPNLLVGVERRFTKHSGMQVLAGPSIEHPQRYEYGGPRGINGYRARAEYRYYLPLRRSNLALYVAPELFYTKYRFTTANTFEDSALSYSYRDTFMVHKESYGMNLKFGFYAIGLPRNRGKRLIFDTWMGMGVKYRTTTHTGRINSAHELKRPRHPSIPYELARAGSGAAFSMTMNVAVGYIIGK